MDPWSPLEPVASSPYRTFRPKRVAVSLLAAVAIVSVGAFAMKALIESTTSLTYTIHWFETVPLLVLAVAFVVNGALNEHAS